MPLQTQMRRHGPRSLPVLVWRWPDAMRSIASSPHGGGIGLRRWVVNAQVPPNYSRRDPDHHLGKLGVSLGLAGRGVGMLTAADVRNMHNACDEGVDVVATVGLDRVMFAAAPDEVRSEQLVGTINIVVLVDERMSEAALVNAIGSATEAKVQALADAGFKGTGTPTDAICIVCPDEGRPATFGGPRSRWGARIARAVHKAVLSGANPSRGATSGSRSSGATSGSPPLSDI